MITCDWQGSSPAVAHPEVTDGYRVNYPVMVRVGSRYKAQRMIATFCSLRCLVEWSTALHQHTESAIREAMSS
jgi:hypothetical protein